MRSNRKKARQHVVWLLATVVFLQLGLAALVKTRLPELHDPEYGHKLHRLQARLAEKAQDQPLVLLLGTSRLAVGIRPLSFPPPRDRSTPSPLVFNYALCGSGPFLQRICLQRLLAQGIRPDLVLVEVYGPKLQMAWELEAIPVGRLWWNDMRLLSHYHPHPLLLCREWCQDQIAPWGAFEVSLKRGLAPSWCRPDRGADVNWIGLDDWGWLAVPPYQEGGESPQWPQRVAATRKWYAGFYQGKLPLDKSSTQALEELLEDCRQKQVPTALFRMPDLFRDEWAPAMRTQQEGYLRHLCRKYDAPLLDMQSWAADSDFHEGVHLSQAGAARLSARFAREALPDLIRRCRPAQGHRPSRPARSDGKERSSL
jgi:hypothetical protein